MHAALIDIASPYFDEPGRKHYVRDMFQRIKKQEKRLQGSRYKGNTEFMICGVIPRQTILYVLKLSDMYQLAFSDEDVASTFALDLLGGTTRQANVALRDKKVRLNARAARAMGKMSRCFGLATQRFTCAHISDFITCLVDGFALHEPPLDDDDAMQQLAAYFVRELGPRESPHTDADVRLAFTEGVARGSKSLVEHGKWLNRARL